MKSKDTKSQAHKLIRSKSETSQPESELGSVSANHSKRRLLKTIAATAPVVMAISSKPALANFCTVSGFLSGNLSNQNSQQFCGGRSPGYWMNHVTADMQSLTFREVFGDVWGGGSGKWLSDPTLYEVLRMVGYEDRYQFGAHAVAAYQNALMFSDYPLSVFEVGDIVSQILAFGIYSHAGTGKTLDAQQVVGFFTQTFD